MVGQFFSPMAKLLVLNPFVPKLFAWRASSDGAVERLIGSTGSRLKAGELSYYKRLFQSETHVEAALGMMAGWDLHTFERRLEEAQNPPNPGGWRRRSCGCARRCIQNQRPPSERQSRSFARPRVTWPMRSAPKKLPKSSRNQADTCPRLERLTGRRFLAWQKLLTLLLSSYVDTCPHPAPVRATSRSRAGTRSSLAAV